MPTLLHPGAPGGRLWFMTDVGVAPDISTVVAELQAQIAQLLQTQATQQGGTSPHAGILAGLPPHTVLGPCDADGRVLPGAWNTSTGLWEDPATAAANKAKADAEQAAAIQAARDQVQAANRAKAIEIAQRELAEEADLAAQVAAVKAELQAAQAGGAPAAAAAPTGPPVAPVPPEANIGLQTPDAPPASS